MESNFVLYRHIRPDKNQVFYIGIGTHERSVDFRRARNKHWRHIFEKNNQRIEVDIILDKLTWEEACRLEKWWISFYGRADLKKGTLCNMTDGGDGTAGPKSPESTVKRIAKITGIPLSKEHKDKLRESKLGSNNPMFGNPNTEALIKAHISSQRKVLNSENGTVYNSVKEAAIFNNITSKCLSSMLSGKKKNTKKLAYLN